MFIRSYCPALSLLLILCTCSSRVKYTPWHPFKSERARQEYLSHYDRREKEWPIPFESKMVKTTFGETYVRISGPDGTPPLILLPGVGTCSMMWMPLIEGLSQRHRTFAVDNITDIGRSVSSRPLKHSSDYTQWLDELFTALNLRDTINLMGGSYGAFFASKYALDHPERISRIILAAPAAVVAPVRPAFFIRALLGLTNRSLRRKFSFWLSGDWADSLTVEKIGVIDNDIDNTKIGMRCFKSQNTVWPKVLTDEELQRLKMPVLYVVGSREVACSATKAVHRLKQVAPSITISVIPGAGHTFRGHEKELVDMVNAFLDNPLNHKGN
jgi:pimeloyl-ACP methyl ester carboxylesterase